MRKITTDTTMSSTDEFVNADTTSAIPAAS
jgi:hypothetical protein